MHYEDKSCSGIIPECMSINMLTKEIHNLFKNCSKHKEVRERPSLSFIEFDYQSLFIILKQMLYRKEIHNVFKNCFKHKVIRERPSVFFIEIDYWSLFVILKLRTKPCSQNLCFLIYLQSFVLVSVHEF